MSIANGATDHQVICSGCDGLGRRRDPRMVIGPFPCRPHPGRDNDEIGPHLGTNCLWLFSRSDHTVTANLCGQGGSGRDQILDGEDLPESQPIDVVTVTTDNVADYQ